MGFSTKFGDGVFSCNAQVQYADGSSEDICLRGLSVLPEGGTSAAVLAHIERGIFVHACRLLSKWMAGYDKGSGGEFSWLAAGCPSPDNIGLHRLAEDTVLCTDTCNGARCTRRLLADAVMDCIKERIGVERWEAMTDEQRDRKFKSFRGDCWQHMRNIVINAMAAKGDENDSSARGCRRPRPLQCLRADRARRRLHDPRSHASNTSTTSASTTTVVGASTRSST